MSRFAAFAGATQLNRAVGGNLIAHNNDVPDFNFQFYATGRFPVESSN